MVALDRAGSAPVLDAWLGLECVWSSCRNSVGLPVCSLVERCQVESDAGGEVDDDSLRKSKTKMVENEEVAA